MYVQTYDLSLNQMLSITIIQNAIADQMSTGPVQHLVMDFPNQQRRKHQENKSCCYAAMHPIAWPP